MRPVLAFLVGLGTMLEMGTVNRGGVIMALVPVAVFLAVLVTLRHWMTTRTRDSSHSAMPAACRTTMRTSCTSGSRNLGEMLSQTLSSASNPDEGAGSVMTGGLIGGLFGGIAGFLGAPTGGLANALEETEEFGAELWNEAKNAGVIEDVKLTIEKVKKAGEKECGCK